MALWRNQTSNRDTRQFDVAWRHTRALRKTLYEKVKTALAGGCEKRNVDGRHMTFPVDFRAQYLTNQILESIKAAFPLSVIIPLTLTLYKPFHNPKVSFQVTRFSSRL